MKPRKEDSPDEEALPDPPICRHSASWGDELVVSLMILNWNGAAYLEECLTSVMAEACRHVEVVLVDNASSDDSLASATASFPRLRIVSHRTNLGFSRGYNVATKTASGQFLIFLNNDTIVTEGWMPPLIEELMTDSGVGISMSKLLFAGTNVINSMGGALKLWEGPFDIGFGLNDSAGDRRVIEPFYASGAAMAISRHLFDRLNGFDEAMTMYGEDVDLSWRARLIGYKIRCVPDSIVFHHFSRSSGVLRPAKVRLVTSHHLEVMLKCLGARHAWHSVPAYMTFALAKGVALAITERDPSFITASLLGLSDVLGRARVILRKRASIQNSRTVADRDALASEDFGLTQSPTDLLRVLRVGKAIHQGRV